MLKILSRFFLAKRRFFDIFDIFSRCCITNHGFNTTNDNLPNKTYIPSEKEELQRFTVLEPLILLLSAEAKRSKLILTMFYQRTDALHFAL